MSAAFPVGLYAQHGILIYLQNSPTGFASVSGNDDFGYCVAPTTWQAIETSKNVYSFTYIQSCIDYVKQNLPGKKVLINTLWNGFSANDNRTPSYIWNPNHPDYDPAYDPSAVGNGGVVLNAASGPKAKIHNAAVRARIKALWTAIYNQYVNEDAFAGIITAETAIGPTSPTDYTDETFISGWEDLLDHKATMPDKLMLFAINFVYQASISQVRSLAEYAASAGVGFAPPDIRPTNMTGADTSSNVYFKVMREKSQKFGDGSVPVFCQFQGNINNGQGGVYTTAQLADFARNQIGCDAAFWRRIQVSPDVGTNFNPSTVNAIAAELASDPYPRPWGTIGEGGGGGPTGSDITFEQGRVALNTGTGNQVIAHSLGATPKFALFRLTRATADDTQTNGCAFCVGMTDGTRQAYLAWMSTNGNAAGTQFGGSRGATDAVMGLIAGGSLALDFEAAFVSWDADDVTINITDAPGSAYLLHYVFATGDDLDAYVNKLAVSTQDSEALLTPNFQSNLALCFSGSGAIDDGTDAHYRYGGGAAIKVGSTITQRGVIQGEVDSANPTAVGMFPTKSYVGGVCNGVGVVSTAFEVTTMSATQVGITPRLGAAAQEILVACLNIGGSEVSISDIVLPSSTGAAAHDIGLDGDLAILFGTLCTAWDTEFQNAAAGIHAESFILDANQYSQCVGIRDNSATSSYTRCKMDDQALAIRYTDTTTGQSLATLTDFSDPNMNLNYTAAGGGIGFVVGVQLAAADETQPTTPGQPTVSNETQSGADATWTAATHASGIQRYKLYLDSVEYVTQTPPTTNSYVFTGLPSNATYDDPGLQISAVGNNGVESELSTARTFSTLSPTDSTAAVFSGIATAVGDDVAKTISITWPQAVDAITPNAQMKYLIYDDSTEGGGFTTQVDETLPGVLSYVINDAAVGEHWLGVRSKDGTGNVDTNTGLLNVTIADITGDFIIPAGTYQLDNGSGSLWSEVSVDISYTVNGASGYMASAIHYDLGSYATDVDGYLPEITMPTGDVGELTIKYESGGVLLGRWLQPNVTPQADS